MAKNLETENEEIAKGEICVIDENFAVKIVQRFSSFENCNLYYYGYRTEVNHVLHIQLRKSELACI